LQEKGTIVLKHAGDLPQEGAEMLDTDVLGHLKTGDLVVLSGRNRGITVIHAEDLRLGFGNTIAAKPTVAPSTLVSTKSNTSNMGTIVFGSITGESSPTTTKIQHPFTRLQVDLLTDNLELIILKLLEGLLPGNVGDNSGSVDHAWAQKPSVKVITAVVVITNLLLI
jgi:hypothetical protein